MIAFDSASASTIGEAVESGSYRCRIVRQQQPAVETIIGEVGATAMSIRRQWMQQMGLDEEEITEYCNEAQYPANLPEEKADLEAMRRISERKARKRAL